MTSRVYSVSHGSQREYFSNKSSCFQRANQLARNSRGSVLIEVCIETFKGLHRRTSLVEQLRSGNSPAWLHPSCRKVLQRQLGIADANKPNAAELSGVIPAVMLKDFR